MTSSRRDADPRRNPTGRACEAFPMPHAAPAPVSPIASGVSSLPDADRPRWMRGWLAAAGIYNLIWGAFVILWPTGLVEIAGLEMTAAGLAIWQCLGMVIGVYGIGYLAASLDPLRHWPITLVGLLGKIFGPIGFVWTASRGEIPWSFGWTILTNDLLWWIPFALILKGAWEQSRSEQGGSSPSLDEALDASLVTDPKGVRSLRQVTEDRPAMLVFLRHAGCTFCREAVSDVLAKREAIEAAGATPVFVHMGSEGEGDAFLAKLSAADLPRIADPERRLYRLAGLGRGTLGELFGWRNFVRAIAAARHGVGYPIGDPLQMPGTMLIHRGRVIAVHRHRFAGERPDYASLACAAAG
jgi:peroxiredoxin